MTVANDFTRTASKAMQLPIPAAIARLILASTEGAHNGLRAANYEGNVTGTGAERLTHPERIAETRNPELRHADENTKPPKPRQRDNRRPMDDLRQLSKASERFVVAIASLLVEASVGDPGDMDEYTWEEAVKDAHLLLEVRHDHHPDPEHDRTKCGCIDSIEAADAAGRDIHRFLHQAKAATDTIIDVYKRYLPHPASRWVQIREDGLHADEVCDTCASLTPPVYVAVRNKERLACRHCNDLWLKAGERPPKDVKQAYHHASQLEYRKTLSRWLDSLGVRACG